MFRVSLILFTVTKIYQKSPKLHFSIFQKSTLFFLSKLVFWSRLLAFKYLIQFEISIIYTYFKFLCSVKRFIHLYLRQFQRKIYLSFSFFFPYNCKLQCYSLNNVCSVAIKWCEDKIGVLKKGVACFEARFSS